MATGSTRMEPQELWRLADGGRAATDWQAPRLVPTSYPGDAPDQHYLLLGDRVLTLSTPAGGRSLRLTLADGTPVDDVLAAAGAAPLAERVPMLAYGANRSPHTLAIKFAHHGLAYDGDAPPAVAAVPVVRGSLGDVDVVGAGLSSQGYIYADLTPSPGTRITAYVTLLDPAQATAVHASEGVGKGAYDCAWVPGFTPDGTDLQLDVLAYAGCLPVFVSPATATPQAFAAVAAADRRFPAADQVTLLGHVLESTGILDPVASLLGPLDGRQPEVVAAELARMLSGQWWYRHNTGDQVTAAAAQAQQLVWDALLRHGALETTSQWLAARGAVLDSGVAYASGPELRLAAQITTA
jgi:hypothetical protein